jgi:hypothetical protein
MWQVKYEKEHSVLSHYKKPYVVLTITVYCTQHTCTFLQTVCRDFSCFILFYLQMLFTFLRNFKRGKFSVLNLRQCIHATCTVGVNTVNLLYILFQRTLSEVLSHIQILLRYLQRIVQSTLRYNQSAYDKSLLSQ